MNKYVGESERAVREVRKYRLSWHSISSVLIRLPLNFPQKLILV